MGIQRLREERWGWTVARKGKSTEDPCSNPSLTLNLLRELGQSTSPPLGFSFHICSMGQVTQPRLTKGPASGESSRGKALGEQGSFPCAASLPGEQGWAAGRGGASLSLDAPAQLASKLLHLVKSGSEVGLGALSVSSCPGTSRPGPSL